MSINTTITGESSEKLSMGEKILDILTTIITWVVILLCYIGVPMGLFAFCKFVLGLTLPWWSIIFSPVWFILARYIPGGFVITTFILWACKVMFVPWWLWIVSIISSCITGFVIWD